MESLWRLVLVIVLMLFFAGLGIAHVISPDRFLKSHQRGGEMLTKWNRDGIRIAGALLTAFAIYVLYDFLHGILW